MAFHNIEKFSIRYFLMKSYNTLGNSIFYRRIITHNRHNVPKEGAVIMAPNHQNALMDALAVANDFKEAMIFLARADIFKKKIIANILYLMKILPIYRIRDGASELQKNKEVFEKTVQVLQANIRLTILPEGNHAGFRRLRPLQKGISRIAFQAEETADFKLGIKIIPVGIDYSHYHNFRGELFINYGKPIEVSDFYETYKANPQKGMNDLKIRLAEKLSKVMMNIQSQEYYDTYLELRDIYRDRIGELLHIDSSKQPGKFICEKSMVAMLDEYIEKYPQKFDTIDQLVKIYISGIKHLKLRDWVFKKESYSFSGLVLSSLLQLILLPVHLYGFINNYLPYKIPVLATRNVKDEQFLSSIRYGVGLFTFPIFYLIFSIVFFSFVNDPFIRLGYVISLPFVGIFSFSYYKRSVKLFAKWRYTFGSSKVKKEEFYKMRVEIRNKMDAIAKEIKPTEPDFS